MFIHTEYLNNSVVEAIKIHKLMLKLKVKDLIINNDAILIHLLINLMRIFIKWKTAIKCRHSEVIIQDQPCSGSCFMMVTEVGNDL